MEKEKIILMELHERYQKAENAEIERIEKLGDTVERCDCCNKPLMNGYEMFLLYGDMQLCSEKCLHTKVTEKEWEEAYDDGDSDENYCTSADFNEFENDKWHDIFTDSENELMLEATKDEHGNYHTKEFYE